MDVSKMEIMQGALDLLVLKTLQTRYSFSSALLPALCRASVRCDSIRQKRYDTHGMLSRSVSAAILFALLSACAAKVPVGPNAYETAHRLKMEDADSLFDKGCFVCLEEAFEIYQELAPHPLDQGVTDERLFKTSLVLALREKELGIHNGVYQERVSELLPDSPSNYLSLCHEIVTSTFSNTGSLGDERLEERFQGLRRLRKIAESDDQMHLLQQQADDNWFGAYIYISLMS
jgi:hypothetical protein